jgi:hypothetical protein
VRWKRETEVMIVFADMRPMIAACDVVASVCVFIVEREGCGDASLRRKVEVVGGLCAGFEVS